MPWCVRCSLPSSDDRALRAALKQAAVEADRTLVEPLLEFRNFGVPLPHHWTTVINSAEFGTDYYTRTAVAKSNTFINRPRETRYFYQDLDRNGARLNGAKRYTVTFQQVPPVKGFWSITLYDQFHFFAPNEIDRYSLGTKSERGSSSRPTARWSSLCRRTGRTRTSSQIGCRPLMAISHFMSAPIGRLSRSNGDSGPRRPWCRPESTPLAGPGLT